VVLRLFKVHHPAVLPQVGATRARIATLMRYCRTATAVHVHCGNRKHATVQTNFTVDSSGCGPAAGAG